MDSEQRPVGRQSSCNKNHCSISTCIYRRNGKQNFIEVPEDIKFFSFPTRCLQMCMKWAVLCEPGIDIKYAKVCSMHFKPSDIVETTTRRKTIVYRVQESAFPMVSYESNKETNTASVPNAVTYESNKQINTASAPNATLSDDHGVPDVENTTYWDKEDDVGDMESSDSFTEDDVIVNETGVLNIDDEIKIEFLDEYSSMCTETNPNQYIEYNPAELQTSDDAQTSVEEPAIEDNINVYTINPEYTNDKLKELEARNNELNMLIESTNAEIKSFETMDTNLRKIFTDKQIKLMRTNKKFVWDDEDKYVGLALQCAIGSYTYRMLQSRGYPVISCSTVQTYKAKNHGVVQKIRDEIDSKSNEFEKHNIFYLKLARSLRAAFKADPQKEVSKFYKNNHKRRETPCIFPDCPKLFANRLAMRKHMLLHKPHKHLCDECGMAFTTRHRLLRHGSTHKKTKKKKGSNKNRSRLQILCYGK